MKYPTLSRRLSLWAICLALFPSIAPGQTAKVGDVIFQAAFDDAASLTQWAPAGEGQASLVAGPKGTSCLFIESPKSLGHKIRVKIPHEKIAGTRLILSALIKSQDVKEPEKPWQGIKLQLYTKGPSSGQRWQQPDRLWGTFDFKPASAQVIVPTDITEASLIIGIENTSGRAWFEDVRILVSAVARLRPEKPAPATPLDRRTDLPRLRGVMYGPAGKPEDIQTLASWDVNLIRWQLHWVDKGRHDLWRDNLPAYDQWLDATLDHLDTLLPLCEKHGIRVLVDLHTPPGGGINIGNWPLFAEKKYQDHFLKVWEKIATRYKNNKAVWGYDIANEPIEGFIGPDCLPWRELALKVCQRIRQIDPDRALVIAPGPSGGWGNLEYMEPLPVPGIIYSPHMYVPGEFTHQTIHDNPGNIPYPGEIRGRKWDKAALKKALDPVRQYQLDYNVPIYIGEFSAIRWAPGDSARQYLSDCIDIFEEYGWDWSYHAFREWQGWSLEHEGDPKRPQLAKDPTSRQKLLTDWFARNKR